MGDTANVGSRIADLRRIVRDAERELRELTGLAPDAPDGGERALGHAAATQGALLDALPANIAVLDAGGTIIAVNEAWRRFGAENALQGAAAGEGQSYLAQCDRAEGESADGAPAVAAGIRAVLSGERPVFSLEYPCRAPDQTRWFRLTVVPVGEGGGAVCIHLDITHERLAAQALRTLEERLRAIVDNEPECVKVTSLDGLVLELNGAGLRLVDAELLSEVQGRPVLEIVHPDDREAFAAHHRRVVAGSSEQHHFRIISLRGTTRWMETNAVPLRRPDGTVGSVLSLTRDVSARRRAEEERRELLLREQAARREADAASRYYRSLFESAPGCYLVLTPEDFTIVAVSEAFLKATLTSREQLAGRQLFGGFLRRADGEEEAESVTSLRASLERVKATQQADVMTVQRHPIRRTQPDGSTLEERFWSTVNCAVPGPDGSLAYLICRVEDVTEYVQLKQQAGEGAAARVTLDTRAEQLEADIVLRALQLRRATEAQAQNQAILRIAGRVARLGGWRFAVNDPVLTLSDETAAICEEPPGYAPSVDASLTQYLPEYRELVGTAFGLCVRDGVPFDLEAQLVTARGRSVWVRIIGEAERDAHGTITHVQGGMQDISEQKAAAEEIHSLGVRLLDTLESITDGFCTVSREWRFTYVNAEAERLLERKRASLLGRNVWEEFGPAVGGGFEAFGQGVMAEGTNVRLEEFYPPLNRWFEVEVYPSREGVAVYFRDVTERRRAREALRESEERFRLLATTAADVVWDWNLVTGDHWWSEGFTKTFGYPLAEIAPTIESWTERVHPDDWDAVIAAIIAGVDEGVPGVLLEYRFRRKDGSYAYVLDRGHILRDEGGTAVRMIGGITDLTERRLVEEKLREQADLLDKAQDAIVVRDLDHRILYWNRSAERLYGWTAAEALGRSILELVYAESAGFLAAAAATLDRGEWVGEIEQVTRAGRPLVVEGHWTLMRDDRGEPKSVLSINTDITPRKKLEAQFLRAQRMESIGALAGGIAHDLNNMLAPILMTVSLMRDEEDDPARREDLVTIESCAQRGADMVRQLLSFARGAESGWSRLNLGAVAAEVQKIVRDTFPKDITFRLSVARDLWAINADRTQMHQVLTNLCVNARDAMPLGGILTVAIEHVVLDRDSAEMALDAQPGPYLMIRVEDTGTGMSAEVLDQIFDPFFTTKDVGKGTGLGLSTAHAIVRNHGGFIHVTSEVGRGTRFKVYLPADVSEGESQEAIVALSLLPRGNGELVLVVDDEEAIRSVARRTLERFGYRTLLACNGAEAVLQYAMHRDEIAVVLTDMAMPVMDGPATIMALKTMNPKVRIIGSSGLDTNDHVARAVGAGVLHFVPKPYTGETMLKALKKVLAEP